MKIESSVIKFLASFSASFIVKGLSVTCLFIMNVMIARELGAAEAGVFFLGVTIATFLSSVGRLGLEQTVVRFVSEYYHKGEGHYLWSVYTKSLAMVMFGCSVIIIPIIYFAPEVSALFKNNSISSILVIILLSVPLLGFLTIQAQGLQGLQNITKSILVLNLIVPMIMLIGLLFFQINNAKNLSYLYVFACLSASLLGFYWWFSSALKKNNINASFPFHRLWDSCYPLWGVVILSQCSHWSSQIIIGIWSNTEEVAFYSAAQRTSMLTSFVLIAVNTIVAPKFAAAFSSKNFQDLNKISLWSARLLMAISLPLFLFIIVFSDSLMGLFGDSFRSSSTILVILSLGQFVNCITGTTGYLLSMTGHERAFRFNSFIGALVAVLLGLVLIPFYGIMGGAIATFFSVVLQNIIGVYQVKKYLGFNPMNICKSSVVGK